VDAEIGSADVLGISNGGMVAQALAVRHPELVDRLVLANTGCRFGDLPASTGPTPRPRPGLGGDPGRTGRRDVHRLACVRVPVTRVDDWPVVLPEPADPNDLEASLAAVRGFDIRDRLDEIDAPTLVFGGTADPYVPEAILEGTAAGMPGAECAFVPGAKHATFHERKATFDARVRTFLDGRTACPRGSRERTEGRSGQA